MDAEDESRGSSSPADERHIPVRHEVIGQALEIVCEHAAECVEIFGALGVPVAQRRAVHAPCLTARPARVVLIALARCAAHGAAGDGVHEERGGTWEPSGRMEFARHVVTWRCAMPGVFRIARRLRRPVEQGNVQQAVDDVAVVVGRAEFAPRLKKLPFLLKAADELVGREDGGLFARLAAGELVRRNAGGRVQEAMSW